MKYDTISVMREKSRHRAAPGHTLGAIFAIELAAVVITAAVLWRGGYESHAAAALGTGLDGPQRFLLLVGLGLLCAELGNEAGRLRRYLGGEIDATSVWCVAGALVLPAGLAVTLVVVLHGHRLVRTSRARPATSCREVFPGATAVLATMLAVGVGALVDPSAELLAHGTRGALAMLAALGAYLAVGHGISTFVLLIETGPREVRCRLRKADDYALELAMMALAVFTAEVVLHAPLITPLTLVVVAVLHRASLVRHLQIAATTDTKTGLLNLVAWRRSAERRPAETGPAPPTRAVLVIDIDRFKTVNDGYGHPVGDAVIRAVAQAILQAVREHDTVGRYGGDEFIALLEDVDARTAQRIAERIQSRIRAVGVAAGPPVTASIGLSIGGCDPDQLDALVREADVALYAAKTAGRDRIRSCPQLSLGGGVARDRLGGNRPGGPDVVLTSSARAAATRPNRCQLSDGGPARHG